MKKEIKKQIESTIIKIQVYTTIADKVTDKDTEETRLFILKSIKSELENLHKIGEEVLTQKEKSEIEFIIAYYQYNPCDYFDTILSKTKTCIYKIKLRQLDMKKLIDKIQKTSEQASEIGWFDSEETKFDFLKKLRDQLDVLYTSCHDILTEQELKLLYHYIDDLECCAFHELYKESHCEYSVNVINVSSFINKLKEEF